MNWFSGSIPDAIAEAKNFNKVFLVYIEGTDELSRKMSATYNDPVVCAKLSTSNCVALKLAADSVSHQQFCAIYPVLVIPSSFFIGKNGIPIEILTGHVEASEFSTKLDHVFQLHQEATSHNGQSPNSAQKEEQQSASSNLNVATEASASSTTTSSAEAQLPNTSSDSTEGNSAEMEPSLEEKIERAKMLVEARKQNREVEEQEKEKIEEQERRKLGKALQKAQQTRHDNELKEWAQNRAKEKEEERQARERIRAQIAQDRAERAVRFQQVKAEELAVQKEQEMARVKEDQERAARDAAMRSTSARLQFRLPDGTSVTHQFPADSLLEDARHFVIDEIRPSFTNFTLCTTFPRRHFVEEDYQSTLRDLQLAPSAAVLVLPGQAVRRTDSDVGLFSSIFWTLVAPFVTLWRAFTAMFRRGTESRTEDTVAQPVASTSGAQPSPPKRDNYQKDEPVAEGQVTQRKSQKFYKKEGNIFRISNQQIDDDDNNTWNGNSTQQM